MTHIYVLRIWRGQATGALRITLKAVASGDVHHFVDGTAVTDFLEKELAKVAGKDHGTNRLEKLNTDKE
ncbi:MAG: hypothetical protein IPM53_33565 [Anaerolineaceae bacterium]|nr:hypothetical protein [Anaerolineaceae bacterium]